MRGAWQWPAFAVFLVGDGLLLYLLPIAGDGPGPVAAVLLAGVLNLLVVAPGAPLAGRLWRRVRPDLPRVVASDYAGTALMAGLAIALLALGLAHRPALRAQHRAAHAQAEAVRSYVLLQAPTAYRRNADRADSWRLDDHLFRTCVPGPDPRRALCLFVDTSRSPPSLRRDPNPVPNWRYFGGRGAGQAP
jgi:hypothetical protein